MKVNPYLENYFKTIICDVDDTLSVTTTHDWQNAEPIW
jgi:capsule biosynthesis phosphatase